MPDDEPSWFIIFLMCVLVIGAIFEVVMLVWLGIAADKVSCNWLWCTFTTMRVIEDSSITISKTMTRNCFLNGAPVNCSP